MTIKALIAICLQTLVIQSVSSRCLGTVKPAGVPSCGAPFISASDSGSFVVTSSSPMTPFGVSVVSDNVYEGSLYAGGNLPLLGAVGLEGAFPTSGAGAVSYGCGDAVVAIVAQDSPVVTGYVVPVIAAPIAVVPGYASYLDYGMGYGYPAIDYGSVQYGVSYGCGFAI